MAYKTNRQTMVTRSTCASEYVACADTMSFLEGIEPHLRLFAAPEIGCPQLDIAIFVDKQSANRIPRGKALTNASKYLKLRHPRVSEAERRLFFCGTKDQ